MRRAAASVVGPRHTRNKRELDLIDDSSLFDPQWYLRTYPDVAEARVSPLHHYMTVGWTEGRDPGPEFSTSAYLKANRDVAAAGVNPLLHFVEFGHQEGRGSSAHKRVRKQRIQSFAEFGPAASCVSFPLPDDQPIRWKRSYQLASSAVRYSAGECVVGLVRDETIRATLESSFSLLKALSGYEKRATGANRPQLPGSADHLIDAWYVTTEQLRTRWRSRDFPVIIRAFQHDPLREGTLCLVGEGLAASPIDAVDLHVKSPYFPVLLIFSTPDGTIRGAEMLAFPSLCRGGRHYSELLQSSVVATETNEVDPVRTGAMLASRLLRLVEPSVSPAISRIEVDIGGGNGRGPMFQSDFQLWLEKVFGITVTSIGVIRSRAVEFLAEAVAIPPSTNSREGGATVSIGSDMVPTVRLLTEPKTPDKASPDEAFVPFLVAGTDASLPAIAIEFPRQELPMLQMRGLGEGAVGRWPRLLPGANLSLAEGFPAAAIAFPAHREMSDSTLFVPVSGLGTSAHSRSPITWIVEARGWPEDGLAQAVLALSVQSGGSGDCLFFVGEPTPLALALARERIRGGINCFDEVGTAICAAPTEVVGYAAAGVLLHDNRTAGVLASLLNDELVATVSCAMIVVNQSRAGWHAMIADGGSFATPSRATLARAERSAATAFLWGSNYPVTVPGAHLWLARKSSLTNWTESSPPQLANGVHICSSEVTASYIGEETVSQASVYIPGATEERATRVRALFG